MTSKQTSLLADIPDAMLESSQDDTIITSIKKLSYQMDCLISTRLTDVDRPSAIKKSNKPLRFDPSGISQANRVTDEAHIVAVDSKLIKLNYGLFYGNNLIVRHAGRTLEYRKDYILGGVSFNKSSSSSSGVYEYILFTEQHVAEIVISYNAVGSNITSTMLGDMIHVMHNIDNVDGILTGLNTKNIADHLQRLHAKTLTTANTASFVFNNCNTGIEWKTIAMLGLDGDLTRIFSLRIESTNNNWMYKVAILLDLDNSNKPIKANVVDYKSKLSSYDPLDTTSIGLLNIQVLYLRVLWKKDLEHNEGCVIQLGIDTSNKEEHITLTNNILGCLSFVKDSHENTRVIELPSGTIWHDNDSCFTSWKSIIAPNNSYCIWAGELPLTSIINGSMLLDLIIPIDSICLKSINSIEFILFDRLANTSISIKNTHTSGVDDISGALLFFLEDLCVLNYTMSVSPESTYMALGAILGGHAINNNRFVLKKIDLNY